MLYNKCDKIMSIEQNILKYIKEDKQKTFCIKDFLLFGDYKAVAKSIERLIKKGILRRLLPGIFDYPIINEYLKIMSVPNITEVANAIARNNGWSIIASSNLVLYNFGLSTQVPAVYVYLSNGPYRKYQINKTKIYFNRASQKYFNVDRKIGETIEVFKVAKRLNLALKLTDYARIINDLNLNNQKEIAEFIINSPIWLQYIIKEIIYKGNYEQGRKTK